MKYTKYDSLTMTKSYYEKQQQKAEFTEHQEKLSQMEKDMELERSQNMMEKARRFPEKYTAMVNDNARNHKISDSLIRGVLFESFINALYLDANVKENPDVRKTLRGEFNKMYDAVGAENIFKEIDVVGPHAQEEYLKNAFHFNLKKAVSSVLESYKSRALDKLKNKEFTPEEIQLKKVDELLDFSLDEDEKSKFEYDVDNLELDVISDSIKKKVLNVVMAERERSQIEKDLEEELNAEELIDDKESVVESTLKGHSLDTYKKSTPTLFRSIMESVISSHIHESSVLEGSISNTAISHRPRKSSTTNTVDNGLPQPQSDTLTMLSEDNPTSDMILADSLTHYTLLETFHTLGITKYTRDDVEELARSLK